MKNRLTRYNNGFIGNVESAGEVSRGVVNLNKKHTVQGGVYPTVSQQNFISYTPPSEWVSLPSFEGLTQYFAGVVAVYDSDTNFLTFQMNTSGSSYVVEWGDGTTASGTDNQILYKQYTSSQYAGLTSSVYRGYKTALVRAYPTSGTITEVILNNAHNQSGLISVYVMPWLNVRLVGSSVSNFAVSSLFNLEQVDFVGPNSITSNNTRFINCRALRKVVNWDTTNCTTFHQMFRLCSSLREIPRLNTSAANANNAFSYMFESCGALAYVPFFDTSNKQSHSFENIFTGCYSLKTIPPFNTSRVTSLQNAFFATGIEDFPWIDTSLVTNWNAAFRAMPINRLPNLNTSSATNFSYCFNSVNLTEFPPFDLSNVTTLFEMFARGRIAVVSTPLNLSKCNSMYALFYENDALVEAPQIIRDGSTIMSMALTYYTCPSLRTHPAFNTDRISSWEQSFINCNSLQNVGFTFNYPVGQTWATSVVFNNTFNGCRNLRSIGISDVSGISGSAYTTAYSNMFANCFSLNYIGLSGISENFNITNCSLGSTALNDLYNRLAVVGASGAGAKTITVSGNWGTATDNPAIAIEKGWSVSG